MKSLSEQSSQKTIEPATPLHIPKPGSSDKPEVPEPPITLDEEPTSPVVPPPPTEQPSTTENTGM
ncbi:MAG: hypothetical protein KME40_02880 [Komarekiella atlantica HA4396-MV6]|nr:hypothetical protein [Komarekiella atlantica HA4396-MV6]